jgi:hypothetical protein
MPASQELDPVIRKADSTTSVDPSCQVLVPIDERTGQPVVSGLWSRLSRVQQRYFLVTNTHRLEAVAIRRNLKIAIEDFARDWRFDLFLDYEAKCQPGHEIRLAQALWQGPHPQERLESLLKGWVLHLLDGGAAELVRNFDRSAESLAQDLRTRAFEQTGLTLAARLRLADTDRLDPVCIGPLKLPIRLRDQDQEIDLQFEAELAVEVGKERIAYLHRDRQDTLDKEVRRKVREHLAARVTLQQFHSELNIRIQSELSRELDDLLAPYGRKLLHLSLGGEALPGVIESQRVEHTFAHPLTNYPGPVQVKTELLLQLNDLGRYVRARTPTLEAWARREVESVAVECLFGITYTELCLHYEDKKSEIERRMKEKAAAIGYEVRQLITMTDLQLDVLRRPFLIQLDGEFATKLAKLKVKLEVHATLVIPQPSQIAALLDRHMDVKAQIRETLRDRLKQRLHQIDPESFYMEFEVAKVEGQPSVRDQLEEVIKHGLKAEFHAEVLGLSCKQMETELSHRLDRLMAPLHPLTVEVVASRGGPVVIFDGSFRVTGVHENGWSAFQISAPEPEKLSDCASRQLRHVLADKDLGPLLQTSNAEQKEYIDRWVRERILAEFGLLVVVMDWTRRPLPQEQQAAAAHLSLVTDTIGEQEARVAVARMMREQSVEMQSQAAQARSEQIQKLQEKLARLQVAGSPEEEESLRKKIIQLQEEQKEALREATAERSTQIMPHLQTAQNILTGEARGSAGASASALKPKEDSNTAEEAQRSSEG